MERNGVLFLHSNQFLSNSCQMRVKRSLKGNIQMCQSTVSTIQRHRQYCSFNRGVSEAPEPKRWAKRQPSSAISSVHLWKMYRWAGLTAAYARISSANAPPVAYINWHSHPCIPTCVTAISGTPLQGVQAESPLAAKGVLLGWSTVMTGGRRFAHWQAAYLFKPKNRAIALEFQFPIACTHFTEY